MFTGKALMLVVALPAAFAVAGLSYSDPLWERVIASWPETAKSTAEEIAHKYGAPDMVGSDLLVWQNKDPYVWIRVHSTAVAHNFPLEHGDVLDIAVPYRVPVNMYTTLAEFDWQRGRDAHQGPLGRLLLQGRAGPPDSQPGE